MQTKNQQSAKNPTIGNLRVDMLLSESESTQKYSGLPALMDMVHGQTYPQLSLIFSSKFTKKRSSMSTGILPVPCQSQ